MKEFNTILLATDFSACSEAACAYALLLARKFDARLLVLHVVNEPVDLRGFYVPHLSFETLEAEIEAGARNLMEQFCSRQFLATDRFESVVVPGIPYDEIIRRAESDGADLIVVGTHGRSGLDHLLFGSTAEKVVRKAPVPVLTIRQMLE